MKSANRITVLSDDLVGKIAAGEVVERPASVVKELLENALDAKAKSISIHIESAGKSLIRVADDGCGMPEDDILLSCTRHATSKISKEEDLENIRTLGFRGEALSSIAAVSQMDLTSSPSKDGGGMYVYVESGQILRKRPAARSQGTTVEVRNLFYNVPARKKFLRQDATELSEIVRIVGRYMISARDVEFKLVHGERTILYVPRNSNRRERIETVLGKSVSNLLKEMPSYEGDIKISGFFSTPADTSKDKRGQIFYLNGRYIRSKTLERALYSSYKSMLEKGRHPACVLFLEVSPESFDVNVHPTKLQVKFKDESMIKTQILEALRASFENVKDERAEGGHYRLSDSPRKGVAKNLVFDETPSKRNQFTYDYDRFSSPRPISEETISRNGTDLPEAGMLHQLYNCYIVSVMSDKILITDQHAAHERIFYEVFSKAHQGKAIEVQNLLFPVRIELSAEECSVADRIIEALSKLGFLVDSFGDRSFVVQSIPAVLKKSDIKSLLIDVISDIKEFDLEKIDIVDELIKITSCKAAIRSGVPLSAAEMFSLLKDLSRCDLPFTCPHGRPVTIELSSDDLEKMFRRK